jgi:hypothetical protein
LKKSLPTSDIRALVCLSDAPAPDPVESLQETIAVPSFLLAAAYSTSGKLLAIDAASKPGMTFQVLTVPSPLGAFLITS